MQRKSWRQAAALTSAALPLYIATFTAAAEATTAAASASCSAKLIAVQGCG